MKVSKDTINYDMLVSPSFNVVENSAVDYYLKGFKAGILDKAGLRVNDDVKTSDVQKTKNQIDEAASSFKNELMFTSLGNTEQKSYTSQSPKISNQQAFAEKLFPGKEIVAAYVGDMSYHFGDSGKYFNSGYFSYFEITIVYKDENNIKIYEVNCFVPWYSNSTDQSLYNSFLNGEEEKTYKLRNEETTVVNNPHMVEEKETKTTIIYNLEFEEAEEGVNAVIGTPLPCP